MSENQRGKRNLTTVQDFIKQANPRRRADLGKTGNGNVIFPGTQMGYEIGQMRDFVKAQKRSKGFTFQTVVGTQDFNLDVSGDGVMFLGMNITTRTVAQLPENTFKLMINEEQIFSKCNGKFLSPETNPNKDMEFFPYPRPMSGSDEIILTVDSLVAMQVFVNVYYI